MAASVGSVPEGSGIVTDVRAVRERCSSMQRNGALMRRGGDNGGTGCGSEGRPRAEDGGSPTVEASSDPAAVGQRRTRGAGPDAPTGREPPPPPCTGPGTAATHGPVPLPPQRRAHGPRPTTVRRTQRTFTAPHKNQVTSTFGAAQIGHPPAPEGAVHNEDRTSRRPSPPSRPVPSATEGGLGPVRSTREGRAHALWIGAAVFSQEGAPLEVQSV